MICGMLLILIGIAGYGYGVSSGNASLTAFIPSVFGIVLVLLGLLAKSKESMRKHLMHAAIVVALLGFLATVGRMASKMSELTLSAAVIAQIAMAVVCLAFVILAVQSFAAARRNA